MHAKHRLGYADSKTGYYTYYQSLLPHASKGIAMPSGTCPVSQPDRNAKSSNTAQEPSSTRNMRYAPKGPHALYALSQNVIIWIAPSTFFQVVNTPPFVAW
eukprot:691996-Pelagomonas_calceolata.AAC.1